MRWLVLVLTLVGWLLPGAGARAQAQGELKVYFFDPDAAVPNPTLLRSAMQDYLGARRPGLRFQPFARFEDFRRAVGRDRPQLAIVASWAFQQEGAALGMRPLFVATRGGRQTYTKVLVAIDPEVGTRDLRGKTLATTRLGADEAILDALLFRSLKLSARDLKVVFVSKEIDALLALSFGQVKAALVTEAARAVFERGDPEMARKLRALAESREIQLPLLVYFPAHLGRAEAQELGALFAEMGRDAKGERAMRLLRFDGWAPPREAGR